jgi:hypothetical protein
VFFLGRPVQPSFIHAGKDRSLERGYLKGRLRPYSQTLDKARLARDKHPSLLASLKITAVKIL